MLYRCQSLQRSRRSSILHPILCNQIRPSSSLNQSPKSLDAATLSLYSQRSLKEARESQKIKWKFNSENPRKAAVLVPLCHVNGVPSILFTVRASKLRKHGGQVSFPGGRMDDTDTSLMYTALRETLEETGLIDFKILGPLPHLPDRSATIEVHPYLAYVVSQNSSSASSVEKVLDRAIVEGSSSNQKDFPNVAELNLNHIKFNVDEVSSVFTLPIRDLLDPKKMTMMQFRSIEGLEVPSWKGPNGQSIWGLTAYILNDLLKKVIAPSS